MSRRLFSPEKLERTYDGAARVLGEMGRRTEWLGMMLGAAAVKGAERLPLTGEVDRAAATEVIQLPLLNPESVGLIKGHDRAAAGKPAGDGQRVAQGPGVGPPERLQPGIIPMESGGSSAWESSRKNP